MFPPKRSLSPRGGRRGSWWGGVNGVWPCCSITYGAGLCPLPELGMGQWHRGHWWQPPPRADGHPVPVNFPRWNFTCESLLFFFFFSFLLFFFPSPSVSIWPSKEHNAMSWALLPRISPPAPGADRFPPRQPPACPNSPGTITTGLAAWFWPGGSPAPSLVMTQLYP